MKTFLYILAIFVMLVTMGFAYYQPTHNTYTLRFRLTVEVDTPTGLKTSSSVIEARADRFINMIPGDGSKSAWTSVNGEAVYVDLGSQGNLIVSLPRGATELTGPLVDNVTRAFGVQGDFESWAALQEKIVTVDLREDNLPTMLTFRDINDPSSVEFVAPDDFARVFGAGIRLKRIWAETTGDPITREIDNHLPWLASMRIDEASHGIYIYAGRPNVNTLLFEGTIK